MLRPQGYSQQTTRIQYNIHFQHSRWWAAQNIYSLLVTAARRKTWVLILAPKVPHTHCGTLLERLPQLVFRTLKLNIYSCFETGKGLNACQVSWFHCEHSGNCAYAFKKSPGQILGQRGKGCFKVSPVPWDWESLCLKLLLDLKASLLWAKYLLFVLNRMTVFH